jgi:hypothetical protein
MRLNDLSLLSIERGVGRYEEGEGREVVLPISLREHITFVSPHPTSLSLKERDFEVLLPFSF